MSKLFWAILGITVAALVGIFVISNRSSNDQANQTPQNPQEITAEDHVEGNPNAKVTLIEYVDFQCSACKNAYPIVKRINQEYSDRLRFVVRHFPLSNIHPNGFAASRAAEAAAAQNQFFAMHNLLYEKQDDWASSTQAQRLFEEFANQLGFDLGQFKEAYGSKQTKCKCHPIKPFFA